jgi:exonuclease SbcD
LGYAQFNLQEREEDLYGVFEESITKSMQEHAEAIILAGDIFHNPRPNGAAIIRLARELKKLKEKSIPVYFVLGEHDISRTNDVPIPYLFHNLGLAKRLQPYEPIRIGNLLIYGFNKERKSNIDYGLLNPFRQLEKKVKEDANKVSIGNKKIKTVLVLHQGLYDFNKFAGEVFASDLPYGFDYYAMGHYHDHLQKRFPELNNNLVAYPGSLDLGHNEPISEVDKGFLLVDLSDSSEEVSASWVKIENRRPQLARTIDYCDLDEFLKSVSSVSYNKKPVLDIKIKGKDVDSKVLAVELMKLDKSFLYYTWSIVDEENPSGFNFDHNGDFNIDNELSNLVSNTLKSDKLSNLSLDLVELINTEGVDNAKDSEKNKNKRIVNYLWNYYENNKRDYGNRSTDGSSGSGSGSSRLDEHSNIQLERKKDGET